MTAPRKKPGWAFWTAVVLLLPVLYVASFGPACWLAEQTGVSVDSVAVIYKPCLWADFKAPQLVRNGLSQYVGLWKAGSTLTALRNRPIVRRYPVGDVAFRWENGCRVFHADLWFVDWFECEAVQPDSWDAVGGPGRIVINATTQSLEVHQTRELHERFASALQEFRQKRNELSGGRDVDIQKLDRAFNGVHSDQDFRPDMLVIDPRGGEFAIDERVFSDNDELFDFLNQQPRDVLRSGIYWRTRGSCSEEPEMPHEIGRRLMNFCKSQDIDLFVRFFHRPCNVIGQPWQANWWVVRASETVYLDPE